MLLCYECAAKVRLNMKNQELVETDGQRHGRCGVCNKQRYGNEYELQAKANNRKENCDG